jgi:hypothetical protein
VPDSAPAPVLSRIHTLDGAAVARRKDPRDDGCNPRPLQRGWFHSKTRAYVEFTADGPIARQGLRREACDLFTENLKRQMRR